MPHSYNALFESSMTTTASMLPSRSNATHIIVPKASCQTASRCPVDLVKSKHMEIVLDFKWLDHKCVESFLSIVSQPEKFHGFLIDEKNLREQRLADWIISSPEEENVVGLEEPPPYTNAKHKRSRGAHSHSYAENSYPPNRKTDVNDPSTLKNNVRCVVLNRFPAMVASFIDRFRSASPSSSSSIYPTPPPPKQQHLHSNPSANSVCPLQNVPSNMLKRNSPPFPTTYSIMQIPSVWQPTRNSSKP
ncbi:hypothetical protein COCMIDRAFT_27051 [Bipolaris oryzae ATCC 44560]|uniref:Uncharacterized protein n=1 Tax=Bipolaris oryzae ATCC 44560 TaxID=930090 RepID=W6ZAX4_COCMI|nr:uncharacterized protein COCMIDRAFT_27051 [Bipolaris oryzae ATCC 44560]EUC44619.1 hypothetical protein COCMIDRAFT_27051 [Bipolaris oryzae ATCC 44560]